MGDISNSSASAAASMCSSTVDYSRQKRVTRASTLRNVFTSFPGLGPRLASSDLLATQSAVPERRTFSLLTNPTFSAELSRDTLYTASTSTPRLPIITSSSTIKALRRALTFVELPKESPARDHEATATATITALRRAMSFAESPKQPLRDREAILQRARCLSRRRSDAAADHAAMRATSLVKPLRHRRASL
ncbi:hypothetical protein T484DRAFT_1742439 [Baffinella frigidus]|nr:hypothetical protein T484DRAFT_1742439 [Cryptophyta sp. CCMP2293]